MPLPEDWRQFIESLNSNGVGLGSENVKWVEIFEDSFNLAGESGRRDGARVWQVDLPNNPSLQGLPVGVAARETGVLHPLAGLLPVPVCLVTFAPDRLLE
jgi:hypothetical protein